LNVTPRMLIATRFGLGIRDPAWFDHRLAVLSAITIPSLLAQGDQEFDWAIFASVDLPEDIRRRLEELLVPFDGRAFIDFNGHSPKNLLAIAVDRDLISQSGHVLTGRIDDDDAWARNTVDSVRMRTSVWLRQATKEPGFGLTFENGLVWVMYEMLDVARLQSKGDDVVRKPSLRPYTYPFTSISGFVCSPLSNAVTPIGGSHKDVPKHLADAGFRIEVVSSEDPMWLYCRHKQSDSALERSTEGGESEIEIGRLSQRFGIDEVKVHDYIARTGEYGYSTRKRIFERRGELRAALKEAEERITDPAVSAAELANIRQKAAGLQREHAQLGENLIVRPGQDVGSVQVCHVIQTVFSGDLSLFDKFCLPSIKAQTCKNFLWHLYCDADTDPLILDELLERADTLSQMRVILPSSDTRGPAWHVVDGVRVGDQAIVTTHLDARGAISKHYVKSVQRHIPDFVRGGDDTLLLNFPRGYLFEPASGRLLFDWAPRCGFSSLFERVGSDAATVISGTFTGDQLIKQDNSIPAWLRIGYGENEAEAANNGSVEACLDRVSDFNAYVKRDPPESI
jgi:hypothetical protein